MARVETDDDFPGGSWGNGLAAVCILLLGFAALTAGLSKLNRYRDEQVLEPTAVADPFTLKPDPRENPGKEVLRWKGQSYFLQTNELVRIPDSEVTRTAQDDSGKVRLYQSKTENDSRSVLVKIGTGEFLALTRK
jgi:hypothetical protein